MTLERSTADLETKTESPLIHLGDKEPSLDGIFSPVYDSSVINRFMTDLYASQKAADAQVTALDGLHGYYKSLLTKHLLSSGRVSTDAPLRILEIGCGFGAATRALLELFPNAHVYASELSLPMLTALRRNFQNSGFEDRYTLLQLNAEELAFKEGSFDLIVGAAILHHLFEPQKVIAGASRILAKTGRAIFFEPFEAGMSVVSLIYQMILRDPRRFLLKRGFYHYLRYTVEGWRNIGTKSKDDPFFHGIDDKWFFTRRYFAELADAYKFSKLTVEPITDSVQPFRDLIRSHFAGNGFADVAPKWVWEIVDQAEASMSATLKRDLATEVCVIYEH
jgi:ubiquinone/menaquinone biosynthesis C-methylase UbiE